MLRAVLIMTLLALSTMLGCGSREADDQQTASPSTPAPGLAAAYDRGLDFLRSSARDGNYGDPGMTAIAVSTFLQRSGGVREEDAEFVEGALAYVAGFQKDNGGIYDRGLANYTTCAAILALSGAQDPKYRDVVAKAADFIKSLQTESGGIGYSDKAPGDPDLSNHQFAMESLRKAGIEQSDPVFSRALKYLQSVQNRSETNNARYKLEDGRITASLDDGGAFYKPTESKAGTVDLPDGRVALRSYGSMSYALLKCYLLTGLPKDDARVADVVRWIRNNYTLEENPGFNTEADPDAGLQGLFYYYFTMAKALDLLATEVVKDADGLEHEWRLELGRKLVGMQGEDGSWKNEADRWMEGSPVLATAYALSALSYCVR